MKQRHPSAAKWAKWPKFLDGDTLKGLSDDYVDHLREWHQDRAQRTMPVYRPELDDAMTPTVGDVRKAYRGLMTTIDDLGCLLVYTAKRIHRLEARVPVYKGVWRAAEEYDENSLVTHDGSMWATRVQSKGVRPGDGNVWQLCVKRGRDARAVKERTK